MMLTVLFMKWNVLITGDCGDPPEIENGLISYISFNATTTTVTYECADGYYFQEGVEYSTSRTCLTSGNWSEENILCSKLSYHTIYSRYQQQEKNNRFRFVHASVNINSEIRVITGSAKEMASLPKKKKMMKKNCNHIFE